MWITHFLKKDCFLDKLLHLNQRYVQKYSTFMKLNGICEYSESWLHVRFPRIVCKPKARALPGILLGVFCAFEPLISSLLQLFLIPGCMVGILEHSSFLQVHRGALCWNECSLVKLWRLLLPLCKDRWSFGCSALTEPSIYICWLLPVFLPLGMWIREMKIFLLYMVLIMEKWLNELKGFLPIFPFFVVVAVELYELFIYFGNWALVSCIACKYFLPICRLSFCFMFFSAVQRLLRLIRSHLFLLLFLLPYETDLGNMGTIYVRECFAYALF